MWMTARRFLNTSLCCVLCSCKRDILNNSIPEVLFSRNLYYPKHLLHRTTRYFSKCSRSQGRLPWNTWLTCKEPDVIESSTGFHNWISNKCPVSLWAGYLLYSSLRYTVWNVRQDGRDIELRLVQLKVRIIQYGLSTKCFFRAKRIVDKVNKPKIQQKRTTICLSKVHVAWSGFWRYIKGQSRVGAMKFIRDKSFSFHFMLYPSLADILEGKDKWKDALVLTIANLLDHSKGCPKPQS